MNRIVSFAIHLYKHMLRLLEFRVQSTLTKMELADINRV